MSASRDEDDFGSLSDENYGESYKSSKSDYSSHGSSSPGATYYYPQPNSINQYMVPYNSHHSNHHNSHHSNQSHHQSSHHNHSMVYPVQYQTPYTSSYSPGGSNSEFTENPAMYYVKQPYSNYSSHNQHSSNHMSSYSSNGSNSNSSIERSYSQSASDSSLVPSALQPSMSYNGKRAHTDPLQYHTSKTVLRVLLLSTQSHFPLTHCTPLPLRLQLQLGRIRRTQHTHRLFPWRKYAHPLLHWRWVAAAAADVKRFVCTHCNALRQHTGCGRIGTGYRYDREQIAYSSAEKAACTI